jgi:hypothetical protein
MSTTISLTTPHGKGNIPLQSKETSNPPTPDSILDIISRSAQLEIIRVFFN